MYPHTHPSMVHDSERFFVVDNNQFYFSSMKLITPLQSKRALSYMSSIRKAD